MEKGRLVCFTDGDQTFATYSGNRAVHAATLIDRTTTVVFRATFGTLYKMGVRLGFKSGDETYEVIPEYNAWYLMGDVVGGRDATMLFITYDAAKHAVIVRVQNNEPIVIRDVKYPIVPIVIDGPVNRGIITISRCTLDNMAASTEPIIQSPHATAETRLLHARIDELTVRTDELSARLDELLNHFAQLAQFK